jgi:hypothetical protein
MRVEIARAMGRWQDIEKNFMKNVKIEVKEKGVWKELQQQVQ